MYTEGVCVYNMYSRINNQIVDYRGIRKIVPICIIITTHSWQCVPLSRDVYTEPEDISNTLTYAAVYDCV